MTPAPEPFDIQIINPTEICYAVQHAMGVPYRRPILDVRPKEMPEGSTVRGCQAGKKQEVSNG